MASQPAASTTIERPSTASSVQDEELTSYEIVARLTIYNSIPQSKRKKPATKKETKTKEFKFIFAKTKANYVDLLQMILDKHHVGGALGKVTERRVYPCKIQVPPTTLKDASDIVDYNEYEALVSKIFDRQPTKAIIILVEMPAVEKVLKKKSSSANSGSDSDSGTEGGDDILVGADGLSKLDYELARLRGLLEKKYANDHDSGYTYIEPVTSTSVPLTPFMLKEWARAMYDGLATVNAPPSTATFDPANRKSSINVASRSRAQSSVSASSTSESSAEVSALTAVSALITSLTGLVRGPGLGLNPITPTKRARNDNSTTLGPIYSTPSKLRNFLEAAETVGISRATGYHSDLSQQGIGPDILHLVEDKDLADFGIPRGDIIRLKEFAPKWWKSLSERPVKRPRTEALQKNIPNPVTPPDKKFRFEKKYHDGGSVSLFGPGVTGGDLPESADFAWHVYSSELKMTVPLPRGVVPIIHGEGDDDSLNDWAGF